MRDSLRPAPVLEAVSAREGHVTTD